VNTGFLVLALGFWVVLGPCDAGPETRQVLAWLFYCWVSVFSVFSTTLMWSLTHALFTPREGTRWYGMIGTGGTIGALTGGYLTRGLAERVGTVNLLLIAAGLLVPLLVIGTRLASPEVVGRDEPPAGAGSTEEAPAKGKADTGAEEVSAEERRLPSLASLMSRSPYLMGIASLIFVAVLAAVFDDYRFKQVLAMDLPDIDKRTAFLGSVYFTMNAVGLFTGLVLTAPLQRRFGPLPGLLVYPALILWGGVTLLGDPSLDVLYWVIALQSAMAYSIFQTSRELLFLPTSQGAKFVAKGFITTFVFRAGTGIGALAIYLAWPEDGLRTASYVTIPLALTIMGIGVLLSREYARRTRDGEPQIPEAEQVETGQPVPTRAAGGRS
jgi:AAA family ATP:ADP antiporter